MSQNNSARWREQYAMQLYVLDYVLYFKYLINCVKQLTVVSISLFNIVAPVWYVLLWSMLYFLIIDFSST